MLKWLDQFLQNISFSHLENSHNEELPQNRSVIAMAINIKVHKLTITK